MDRDCDKTKHNHAPNIDNFFFFLNMYSGVMFILIKSTPYPVDDALVSKKMLYMGKGRKSIHQV